MLKHGMTIDEAAHEWVREMNRFPLDMVIKIFEPNWDDFLEVTTPSVGDSVYVYDIPESASTHNGEIDEVQFDPVGYATYVVELDDGELIEVEDGGFEIETQSDLPMWGTMWQFGDSLDDYWLENKDGIRKMSECGFRVFQSEEFGYFFGIDGTGYDFYEAHWIPLYKARGLQWHDEATERGGFVMGESRRSDLFIKLLNALEDQVPSDEVMREILVDCGFSKREREFLGYSVIDEVEERV